MTGSVAPPIDRLAGDPALDGGQSEACRLLDERAQASLSAMAADIARCASWERVRVRGRVSAVLPVAMRSLRVLSASLSLL